MYRFLNIIDKFLIILYLCLGLLFTFNGAEALLGGSARWFVVLMIPSVMFYILFCQCILNKGLTADLIEVYKLTKMHVGLINYAIYEESEDEAQEKYYVVYIVNVPIHLDYKTTFESMIKESIGLYESVSIVEFDNCKYAIKEIGEEDEGRY